MAQYRQLFSDAQRQQAMADALSQRAMQSRAPVQQGRIAPAMGIGEGLTQLGEALIARRAGKRASASMSQAEEARRKAQAEALGGLSRPQNYVERPEVQTPYARAQQALEADVHPAVVGEYMESQRPKEVEMTDDEREFLRSVKDPAFRQYLLDMKAAGANSVNIKNEGTIPPGYRAERDPQGNITGLVPIPGGPAAAEVDADAEKDRERRTSEVEGQDLISQEIDRIFDLMDTGTLPDTGFGAALANAPNTDAKAISGLLDTIKARIGFDELNRMRQQSPTGGALGNVTERELGLLQAIQGSLDQSHGPMLRYNLTRLWNATQDVIHGPGSGPPRKPLPQVNEAAASGQPAGEAPADVDPELWKYLTPEQRKLWQN